MTALFEAGYHDVQVLEARDRMGGRVHTIDIRQAAQHRLNTVLQRAGGARAEEQKEELGSEAEAEAEEATRLRRLLACAQLGVVDEGAAFVHGYGRRNRVSAYIPLRHTAFKSEHREQWRDSNGQPLEAETVREARRIYSLIDHTVLTALMQRDSRSGQRTGRTGRGGGQQQPAHTQPEERDAEAESEEAGGDVSFKQCFDEAQLALWQRKRRKWQVDLDGEEEDEQFIREQEEQQQQLQQQPAHKAARRKRKARRATRSDREQRASQQRCR